MKHSYLLCGVSRLLPYLLTYTYLPDRLLFLLPVGCLQHNGIQQTGAAIFWL